MNRREKVLAATVGSLVLMIVLIVVVGRIRGLFESRHDRISALEQEIGRHQLAIREGTLAQKKLADFTQRSLPGDRTLARSLYQEWLLERAVKSGFESVNVSPTPGAAKGDVYYQHSFMVNGQANLKELTEFLYALESAPYLQRISRLTAKPLAKSKDLDLSITVDALSLNDAPKANKLDKPVAGALTHGDLQHYIDSIVRRNVFGTGNKQPEFSSGNQTGYPNQPLRFQVRGRDPDADDKLTYAIEGTPLPGAKLDAASGQFEWTPDKLGEYEITFRVTDNGVPAKSQTGTMKIRVVDPPPPASPPAKFDVAQQSVLTGITEISGKRQAWITVRTEGRVLKLSEGDPVDVGTVKGKVSRIDASHAEITMESGNVLSVSLGKSLMASPTAESGT
jgi:hypothetical protein